MKLNDLDIAPEVEPEKITIKFGDGKVVTINKGCVGWTDKGSGHFNLLTCGLNAEELYDTACSLNRLTGNMLKPQGGN